MNYDELLERIKGLEARVSELERTVDPAGLIGLDELTKEDIGGAFIVVSAEEVDCHWVGERVRLRKLDDTSSPALVESDDDSIWLDLGAKLRRI